MPISALTAFDSSGLPYDPLQIVSGGLFDVNKYLTYSPLYISSTLAISYGLAFASFTAVFVHTFSSSFPPLILGDTLTYISP